MSERAFEDANGSTKGRSLSTLPRWIRFGTEVLTPSGQLARVEGVRNDGFLQLVYKDGGDVRLHHTLVAPRNAEPVRVGRAPSNLAREVRVCGVPRPGKA